MNTTYIGDDGFGGWLDAIRQGTFTLQRGSSGDIVAYVQGKLGVSPADGQFGPLTEKAVKAAQRMYGIKPDGVIGKETISRIESDMQASLSSTAFSLSGTHDVLGASPMNGYQALGLGCQRRTILGDGTTSDSGGSGNIISSVFDMLKQGTQGVIQMKSDKDAAAKAAGDSSAALNAATAADKTAKDALAKALVSEALNLGSASADRLASDLASQAEDAATAGLSPDNQKKRADAARAALQAATNEWQAASAGKDANITKVKELWVKAAQMIYAKTQNAMLQQAAQVPGGVVQHQQDMVKVPSQSWFTRPVLGPIPGIGVVGILAAAGTAVAVMLKKRA